MIASILSLSTQITSIILTTYNYVTRAWEVARTIVAPPSSVMRCLWVAFVWGCGVLFLSCECVSVSGVLFSVGVCVCVCVCDLLIFLPMPMHLYIVIYLYIDLCMHLYRRTLRRRYRYTYRSIDRYRTRYRCTVIDGQDDRPHLG